MKIDDIQIVPLEHSSKDFELYETLRYAHKDDDYDNHPEDYLKFVEYFGEGIFGDYVRIFPPVRGKQLSEIWKKYESENDTDFKSLAKDKFGNPLKVIDELILIGDTLDGDHIFYWNKLYYVYHFQVKLYIKELGSNILDVLKYYESGEDWGAIEVKKFTPFNSELVTSGLSDILNSQVL